MSTYLELQNRIATDYLNRTDFGAQVQRSIQQAIRFYERRRWRFNETSTALTTSASLGSLTLPSNLLELDSLWITQAGNRYELIRTDQQDINEKNASSASSVPSYFTIYSDQIELAVLPNSAYSVTCYYLKSLTTLSADSDTNSWTSGIAQDVIVYHATKLMWANVLRNHQEAQIFAELERGALAILDSEHEQFQSLRLKPTSF